MRQQITTTVNRALLFAALIAILLGGNTYSQNNEALAKSKYPFAIENLNAGITSDNPGLRKSAIYMAGYYQINGSVDALISQLDKETNSGIKVLIALTLFQIGDERGIEKIEELAKTESDSHVRHMYASVLSEYAEIMNSTFASN
jgi:HEAT repeat protein